MPARKAPRIVKRKSSPQHATKRRAVKRRNSPGIDASPDALLIAAFAEALGQPNANRPKRSARRSLSEALARTAMAGDVMSVMPGVRVTEGEKQPRHGCNLPGTRPNRRKFDGIVQSVASWCVTLVVTAGIVSAAAYGVTSQAPKKTIQAIASASASQF